ncbi:MAG TPA: hypothetical protein VGO91_06710 [Pyrinomonadaceae bacterium]|jgi:hypothetical protein|nr:hypothetical protein [Pyrinomonadaceae bacterium]
MKNPLKNIGTFLADPTATIFGITVFTFMWMWTDSEVLSFQVHIFWGPLLLISSVLLIANKEWSNLLAAILCGFLPLIMLREFLTLPHNAEVPMLSYEHFKCFFRQMQFEGKGLLFIGLNLLILLRGSFALMRMTKARK